MFNIQPYYLPFHNDSSTQCDRFLVSTFLLLLDPEPPEPADDLECPEPVRLSVGVGEMARVTELPLLCTQAGAKQTVYQGSM